MRIFTDVKGYATPENAIKALDKALATQGSHRDNVRWLVTVTPAGRFAPVIILDARFELNLCALANAGVCVTN